MKDTKLIKVILDSDVIIHFIKGNCLNLLPRILPSYSFVILDIVYESELAGSHKTLIQNTVNLLKTISFEKWEPLKEEREEFFELQKKCGLGESAAMVYCKYRHDVLASSNLKDIVDYCEMNQITYEFLVNPLEGVYGVHIPAGQWHTLEVLESGTVIFEVKDGPYAPLQPEDILMPAP